MSLLELQPLPGPTTLAPPPLVEVATIVVLRGGGLGDLVMALPALQALRGRYPRAALTLLGTVAHARLLAGRPGPVDEVLALPVIPGVHEPPGFAADPVATAQFVRQLRGRGFDLAVQLHGGGRWSNPLLHQLAAGCTVGSQTDDAQPLDRSVPFRYYHHETLRALEVVGLVGATAAELQPTLAVLDSDLAAADAVMAGLPRPVLAVHPGASDARRRWPCVRFAQVTAALVNDGCGALVLGTPAESELVHGVVSATRRRLPRALRTSVRALPATMDEPQLVGVLARSAALLGNDSGPRHLAGALDTATVAVYWAGNLINAGPLRPARHRVHIGWTVQCPVCGRPCADATGYHRCEHDVSFVAEVEPGAVLADLRCLLSGSRDG